MSFSSSPSSAAADQDDTNTTSPPPLPPCSDDHSCHYFIELYFDAALENQFLKSWNALSRRHISSRLINLSSRPHLTLFLLNSPFSSIQSTLRSAAAKFSPLALSFSATATGANLNPNTNDLFFIPTPTMSLLNFHSNIYDALRKDLGDGLIIPDEYRPNAWLPLCPAALDVPRARVAEALGLLQELLRSNVGGFGMEIALVERSPHTREVFSIAIGSSGGASADG